MSPYKQKTQKTNFQCKKIVDYLLFVKKDISDINFNKEEVGEVAWVKKDQLLQFLKEKEGKQVKPNVVFALREISGTFKHFFNKF